MASRRRGTDGSLLSSLPWTLSSLALALMPHLQFLPAWIALTYLGCAAWRYMIERRRSALPHAWFRAMLALVCFLGVLAHYQTISGVGPGSALLAVMASLKILETRRRRDQFVLLFIAIFLVMSSLLREQYLWSLPYMLVALVFIATAWLRMSASPAEPIRRSLRTAGRLLVYAAPLAVAMWVLFPRIASPFWAVPIDTSSGVTGLSDTMSPGDISSLSLSSDVAFRARFFDAVPEPRDRYWRALVLYRFNGRSWSGSDAAIGRRPAEQVEVRGTPVRYQITMEPTRQQWLPALEVPYRWDLPRTFMGRMQELIRIYPIDQRVAFEVESYTDYRAELELSNFGRSWFTSIPRNSNPRTIELALELYRQADSRRGFIDAVLARFHDEDYFYTLRPPALGSDPVDRFLFDTRRGFCEHYASAFALMMRAAGIPSRVVLGFQGGEVNPMGDYMIVRQSDAHAWVEVWLEGRGWVRVDPTAAVAPERIDLGFSESLFEGFGAGWGLSRPSELLHKLRLTWDALNARWNDLILGYGPDKQNNLMRALGMDNPSWRKMMLTLIAAVVLLTVGISLVLMLRYGPPPRDRAALLYDRFVRKTGMPLRTGETPAAFAERAGRREPAVSAHIGTITRSYLEARYGGANPAAIERLEREVAAMPPVAKRFRRARPSAPSLHR